MMRSISIAALLAPGVLAGGCIAPMPGHQEGSVPGNLVNDNGAHKVPAHMTHTWSRISPSDVISQLHSIASATPSAIQFLPGVPVPSGHPSPVAPSHVGGHLPSSIQPPPGCSFPGQSTTDSATATGTGADATSGVASSTAAATSGASNATSASVSSTSNVGNSGASNSTMLSKTFSKTTLSTASASTTAPSTTTPATKTSASTSTKASTSKASSSSSPASTQCADPELRPEWRSLSSEQQSALVQATLCLMTSPPRSNLPGVKSRWDDLVALHQVMAPTVHQVGQFLAWHRQFLWMYQQELKNTCSYTGPIPWWDETRDAGHFANAPMMTSSLYGSAPDGSARCVSNSAFAGAVLDIGPGSSNVLHCLSRGVDESLSSAVTNSFVSSCNSYTDFNDMYKCSFFGPHAYTHDAVGGDMTDVATSPNDPLFFLHHAFIDRNYRNWQLVSPHDRTYAIGGYTTQSCVDGGSGCVQTTLNDLLDTKGFYPAVTVGQVSDTQGGHLCYYYDY